MRIRSQLRLDGAAPISLFSFQDIIFTATGIFLLVSILLTLFGELEKFAAEDFLETAALREELNDLAGALIETNAKLSILKSVGESGPLDTSESQPDAGSDVWIYDLDALSDNNRSLRTQTHQLYQDLGPAILEMNRKEYRLEMLQSGMNMELIQTGQTILRKGQAHDFREMIFVELAEGKISIVFQGRPDLTQHFASLADFLDYIQSEFIPASQTFLVYLKPSGIPLLRGVQEGLRKLGFRFGYQPMAEEAVLR
jgi:hypothetical protein